MSPLSTKLSTRLALGLCAAIATSALLTGCFGGNSTERTYFSVQYPVENVWSYERPRYQGMVRVQRFDCAMAYDRQEMVYRSNPHQFQYYWYKLWAAKPRKMLREAVTAHLRQSNLFSGVVLDVGDKLPVYELRAEILAIEELDASAEQWYAHLSMRLTLVRYEDGNHIWEYVFDERKQVYNRQPVFVVRAMSEIAEKELGKAFADLDQQLAEITGAEAPPGGPGVALQQQGDDTQQGDETDPDEEEPQENVPRATLKKPR
jgi:ABC-type uncharacterized transport system auxiliary subunit